MIISRPIVLQIQILILILCVLCINAGHTQIPIFRNASDKLGSVLQHNFNELIDPMPLRVSAGIAAADIDNDGDQDFFCVLGDNAFGKLLLNNGKGVFEDISVLSDFNGIKSRGSGPVFFDYNNDALIDLIVGSVDGSPPRIFINKGKGQFSLVNIHAFDILQGKNTISITAVDYNLDGLTDLFFSHWSEKFEEDHFWLNRGNGVFVCADKLLGFYNPTGQIDYCHAANFADINHDGYPDLLLCSDFGTSQLWYNEGGSHFNLNTTMLLDAENAMGGAVGDFDNDGDFDWFVTSVFDNDGVLEGNWGGTGNRFYINQGDGTFTENAKAMGLQDASWGWGTTFGDLNNDGYLDIVAVNGWPQGSAQFKADKLRIFLSHQGEFFTEEAIHGGLIDSLQGRGVICMDYDLDGDLDILVSNYRGPVTLWENMLDADTHFLCVILAGTPSNSSCLESRVSVYAGGKMFTRMISAGSNYVSQNPAELHFGLGEATHIDSIQIVWNDGSIQREYQMPADRRLVIRKEQGKQANDLQANVYPNPGTNFISVFASNINTYNIILNIHDMQGRLVLTAQSYTAYMDSAWFRDVDISALVAGKYILTLDDNAGHLYTNSFVKF